MQEPVHHAGCTGSCFSFPSGLEDLSREFQLFFVGKRFVEFLHVRILHIISLRGPVYSRDAIKVSRNQFPAQKERVIRTLRQIMIANAKLTGISETALTVEGNKDSLTRFSTSL